MPNPSFFVIVLEASNVRIITNSTNYGLLRMVRMIEKILGVELGIGDVMSSLFSCQAEFIEASLRRDEQLDIGNFTLFRIVTPSLYFRCHPELVEGCRGVASSNTCQHSFRLRFTSARQAVGC